MYVINSHEVESNIGLFLIREADGVADAGNAMVD